MVLTVSGMMTLAGYLLVVWALVLILADIVPALASIKRSTLIHLLCWIVWMTLRLVGPLRLDL